LGGSFSDLLFFEDFSHLLSLSSVAASLKEFLRILPTGRLACAEPPGPWAVCKDCDVLFDANPGRNDLLTSSSLSDGLRNPVTSFFIGDPPRELSGIAEGNNVGRVLLSADCDVLLEAFFDSSLWSTDTSRLLLLCIGSGLRDSSELLPVPRITTGASRLRK
jgi:hypothetical protein